MLEIFNYSFIVRGLLAGIIIGAIAPFIGLFLVLKRYSLIADTLSHVSFLGIAFGLLLKLNPIVIAIASSLGASLLIEQLRSTKKIYSDSILSIFLSGSLALAITIVSYKKSLNFNISNLLFGSLSTVSINDLALIAIIGMFVLLIISIFFKEIIFATFDEDVAKVSGINVKRINMILIFSTSLIIAVSIPIIGILLISALMIIPVTSALQLKTGFKETLFYAELFSISSVVIGIIASYYLDLSTGGTVVLVSLLIFTFILLFNTLITKNFKVLK